MWLRIQEYRSIEEKLLVLCETWACHRTHIFTQANECVPVSLSLLLFVHSNNILMSTYVSLEVSTLHMCPVNRILPILYFQHLIALFLVKLILHTVRHNAFSVICPFFSLCVSAKIGNPHVFGCESFHTVLIAIPCCIQNHVILYKIW
jgi:hypothetical protein